MQSSNVKRIPVENLLIDLRNPRYDPRTNQREALATIARDQGIKLANLAEDIVERGLNPSDLPMVEPTDQEGFFTVLEGNRRIAAIKILSSGTLLSTLGLTAGLVKRYKNLHDAANDTLPKEIDCVVTSREDSNYWILQKHTGENEGIGIVNWDGRAKQRFRGTSPALQAIDYVESLGYLDEETKKKLPKIAITNIERILNTPDARKELGVEVSDQQLILPSSNEEEALVRLSIIVSDIAHQDIKVTHLDTKEQRVEYAKAVVTRSISKTRKSAKRVSLTGTTTTPLTGKTNNVHRINPERLTLIPKQFKIEIPQTRINRIYHELSELKMERFINSCAVLFRVFVELSLDDFAKRKTISFKITPKPGTAPTKVLDKEIVLRKKIEIVADYLEENSIGTKAELRGVRALISNRDHILSVDSLNAYVHNKDYNPTGHELRGNWDNIQVFIGYLWTK